MTTIELNLPEVENRPTLLNNASVCLLLKSEIGSVTFTCCNVDELIASYFGDGSDLRETPVCL